MKRFKLLMFAVSFSIVLMLVTLMSMHENSDHKRSSEHLSISSKRTDVVILLTMMRSGSSIVGSIFNERPNVTYLYEPLFPIGLQACDNKTREDALKILRHISECQFQRLPLLYAKSTRDDMYSE